MDDRRPNPESLIRGVETIERAPPHHTRASDARRDAPRPDIEQRLYQLIRQSRPIADRDFEIEFLEPGVEAYAFTFG